MRSVVLIVWVNDVYAPVAKSVRGISAPSPFVVSEQGWPVLSADMICTKYPYGGDGRGAFDTARSADGLLPTEVFAIASVRPLPILTCSQTGSWHETLSSASRRRLHQIEGTRYEQGSSARRSGLL
jgi:hypothetical protein